MKIALVHDYLKSNITKFAPFELVIVFQIILIITGLVLVFKEKILIKLFFPDLKQLLAVLLIGLLIAILNYFCIKRSKKGKELLDWIYSEHIKRSVIWSFILFPGLVSLGEEIFFRGYLQSSFGLVFSTLMFSLYHLRFNQSIKIIIPLTLVLGAIFGYSYRLTGNLLIPIILHFQLHAYNIYMIRNKMI